MHDCFGKPLYPFDRVRAATKEELEAQGHPEKAYPAALSPAEQFLLPGQYTCDTCNVYVAPEVTFQPFQPGPNQPIELKLQIGAWPQLFTARALVKVG